MKIAGDVNNTNFLDENQDQDIGFRLRNWCCLHHRLSSRVKKAGDVNNTNFLDENQDQDQNNKTKTKTAAYKTKTKMIRPGPRPRTAEGTWRI